MEGLLLYPREYTYTFRNKILTTTGNDLSFAYARHLLTLYLRPNGACGSRADA
jgi:hypothetical protein